MPTTQGQDKSELANYLRYDNWWPSNAMRVLAGLDYHKPKQYARDKALFGDWLAHAPDDRERELAKMNADVERLRSFWSAGAKDRSGKFYDHQGYPPAYFIEWALCKKFRPGWLDWAIERGLYHPKQGKENPLLPETSLAYSTPWLTIQQAAIVEFFNPRRNHDAKSGEVVEWIKRQAKNTGLPESDNIAQAIFTIIKPKDHDPKKTRIEPPD